MAKIKNAEITLHEDGQHLWYNNMQFVSLKRFMEMKNEQITEMKLLQDEVERLGKENAAYRVILKEQLNNA